MSLPIEPLQGYESAVKISLDGERTAQELTPLLADALDDCVNRGVIRILLDFNNVEYPGASMIAALVAATSRVRRLGGELKIVNITTSARNNFATFSPISYLAIEADQNYALKDFPQIHTTSAKSDGPATIPKDGFGSSKETEPNLAPEPEDDIDLLSSSWTIEGVPMESVPDNARHKPDDSSFMDLAEDPIIGKLEDSFDGISSVQGGEKRHLRVSSEASKLYEICDFVTDYARAAGLNHKEVGKTKIAVYEACLNIVEHAYHSNPNNWIDVWVEYDITKLTIEIKDYGQSFEGFLPREYDVVSAMDGRQTGGFGLYIIRRSMDELDYTPNRTSGNLLKLVKYLPGTLG
jgi:anti-sigma regulatory factor (Ser/Thr protein kinase)/anti-anti-sigma regulatory factor